MNTNHIFDCLGLLKSLDLVPPGKETIGCNKEAKQESDISNDCMPIEMQAMLNGAYYDSNQSNQEDQTAWYCMDDKILLQKAAHVSGSSYLY